MGFFHIKVLSFGIVFAATMLSVSYKLYHLNNFKILSAFLGVVCLFLVFDLFPLLQRLWKRQFVENKEQVKGLSLFQVLIYALLPLIGCLPGLLSFDEFIPFFTLIEVFSVVVPVIWMGYLFRELDNVSLWEKFLYWVGLTTFLASCWGILEYFGLTPSNFLSLGESRVKSTFGNINYFAGYLVVILPFLTQIFVAQSLKLKKNPEDRVISHKFLGSVVFVGIVALHLTKTRAALSAFYLSMGLSFLYWLFVENYKKTLSSKIKKNILFGIPFLVGVLGIVGLGVMKIARLESLMSSFKARFFSWKSAFLSIYESPLFGHGPGTSYQLFFDYRNPNFRLHTGESSFRHAHSEILEFLQEGGLFGFTLNTIFWSILFYILFSVWKGTSEENKEHEDPKLRYLSLAIGSSFIAYFAHSIFSVAPRMMVVKLPLYTLFGLTFTLAKFSDFKGLPLRVPLWWKKVGLSLSSPQGRFVGFFILIGFSGWGLYQFIPSQYLHHQLLSSPTNAKNVRAFEDKIGEKNTPYFLGHLIGRQFRLGRMDGLEKSFNQLDNIFSNWRDHKYKMAVFNYKKGNIEKAKSLALDFQNTSDTYYEPNIKFLMSMAKIKGDYPLFKKELKILLKYKIFGLKLNSSEDERTVLFRETKENYLFNFKEEGEKFFVYYNDKILKSIFYFSLKLRKLKGSKHYSKNWTAFKNKVTVLLNRSQYFGIELNKNSTLAPQEVKTNINQFFGLRNQKEKSLRAKRNDFKKEMRRTSLFYGRQKYGPYYIRMKVNLLRRKEQKALAKLGKEFDKKMTPFKNNLESVTNWSKTLRKIDFKRSLLELINRLPL